MTSAVKRIGPRFGIWAVVYGTSASLNHPEDPPDASWTRNRNLVLEAEALGIDSVLVAQHIVNPFGDEFDQLETLTSCAALAERTEELEIIAAIKPYLFHPAVFAKMALQIEEISQGRFSLNMRGTSLNFGKQVSLSRHMMSAMSTVANGCASSGSSYQENGLPSTVTISSWMVTALNLLRSGESVL